MRRTLTTSIAILGLLGVFAIAGTTVRAADDRPAADGKGAACNPALNLVFGAGANQFNTCLSSEGNVVNFVFSGTDQFIGFEGYQVCAPGIGLTYFDLGAQGQSGWGAAAIVQPKGPGTLPITITRNTTDGHWNLKQTYAKDTVEDDFTITMTLKNTGGPVGAPVYLGRWNDFDNDATFGADDGIVTTDSIQTRGAGLRGVSLQAITRTTAHFALLGVYPTGAGNCTAGGVGSLLNTDLAGHVEYNLGGFNAGQVKTVKFTYARK